MGLISRRLHKRGLQRALSSAQFSLKLNITKSMKHTHNFHFSDHSESQFNMHQLGFCWHNWHQQSDFQKSLASALPPKQIRLSEQALHTRCRLLWKNLCTSVMVEAAWCWPLLNIWPSSKYQSGAKFSSESPFPDYLFSL